MPINYFVFYWFLAGLVFFSFYCKHLFKVFTKSFAIAASYTVIQSWAFSEWIDMTEPYSSPLNFGLKIHHMQSLLVFMACLLVLEKIRLKREWLMWICVTNIVVTIIYFIQPYKLNEGWLSGLSFNPVMNAGITVITLPFLFLVPGELFLLPLIPSIILIFAAKNITPVLALGTALFGSEILKSKKRVINILVLLGLFIGMVYFVRDKPNIADRVYNYVLFGKYWWNNFNVFIGSGNGSFTIWGPVIQKMDWLVGDRVSDWLFNTFFNPRHEVRTIAHWYWLWLHSDIYQTLFELGIMGFLLWVSVVYQALKFHWKNEMYLSGSLTWLTISAFYYPLHFPIQLFIGMCLIQPAIKNPHNQIFSRELAMRGTQNASPDIFE